MKKHLLALLCALALLLGAVPAAAALEGDAQRAADKLALLNLMDDQDLPLEAPVTRAQAAVLLVKLAGAEQAARANPQIAPFRDVPAWAELYVGYAAQQDWVQGKVWTEYLPDQAITANAWCAMLLRMMGYSDKAGDFAVEDAAVFAQHIGLISYSCSGSITRGELYSTMADALTFSPKGSDIPLIQTLVETGVCPRAAANALGLLDRELTARQIADRHMAAVVCLDLYQTPDQYRSGEESDGSASAFFITPDGLALTNYHSISERPVIYATLITGEVYPVTEIVYYDKAIDLAVIRISNTSLDGKTTSAFASLDVVGSANIRAGDVVYTLGNPLGLGLAISDGLISATARKVERYALPCIMSTADISQGSSGGALMNVYGQVVAVTSGAYAYGNNMYLAVPADPVLAADLTADGVTLADFYRQTQAEKKAAGN